MTGDGCRPHAFEAVRRTLGLSLSDTWIAYFAVGGNGSKDDLLDWLSGDALMPDRDHDFVAQALNDEAIDRGLDHLAAYRVP